MNVAIQPWGDGAKLPRYGRPGDAALDCHARTEAELRPGRVTPVPLGFAVAIPPGHVGLIADRSGLAREHGILTLGGVIDPNYRGEVTALMTTLAEPVALPAGTRVCQLLILPAPSIELQPMPELPTTERGSAGFGSSGRD